MLVFQLLRTEYGSLLQAEAEPGYNASLIVDLETIDGTNFSFRLFGYFVNKNSYSKLFYTINFYYYPCLNLIQCSSSANCCRYRCDEIFAFVEGFTIVLINLSQRLLLIKLDCFAGIALPLYLQNTSRFRRLVALVVRFRQLSSTILKDSCHGVIASLPLPLS